MPLVPENVLEGIKNQIVSKFPEMKGVTPKTERITLEPQSEIYKKLGIPFPKTRGAQELIALNFSTEVKTDDGFNITRTVRVLIDASGTILKITTSK